MQNSNRLTSNTLTFTIIYNFRSGAFREFRKAYLCNEKFPTSALKLQKKFRIDSEQLTLKHYENNSTPENPQKERHIADRGPAADRRDPAGHRLRR